MLVQNLAPSLDRSGENPPFLATRAEDFTGGMPNAQLVAQTWCLLEAIEHGTAQEDIQTDWTRSATSWSWRTCKSSKNIWERWSDWPWK